MSLSIRSARRPLLAAACAVVALVLSLQVVSAHVGVQPTSAPPDGNQTFTVRVPNEKPESTVKVRVEFPAGLVVSRFQPKVGWTRQVERDGQQLITAVTWAGGQIGDGEYEDFSFIARTPKEAGALQFKSYQTYQSGEVVEWVNPPGSPERTAAVVNVTSQAATVAGSSAPSVESAKPAGVPAPGAAGETVPMSGSGSDLPLLAAIGAAVLALLALIMSGAALARRPRAA